jgi:hypothetical protein
MNKKLPEEKKPRTQTEKFERLAKINPNLKILAEKFDLVIKL